MLLMVPGVMAPATGSIRIDPALPVMVASPADFEVWAQPGGDPSNYPNILLAMTQECYDGLSGSVGVTWSGGSASFAKADFTAVTNNGDKVPSALLAEEGTRYTVASLKDHLSMGLSEPLEATDTIYWAMKPFLSGPITGTPQTFTVTFSSTSPRMLIYALGKTDQSLLFNSRVPPTIPGFVVPELGTMLLALAPLSAFGIYAIRRRKASH
jgi:hypothetical protein